MANFILDDLKNVFSSKENSITKIIVINVIVFVLFNIIDTLIFGITNWFALPGNFLSLITKPWTPISYMFLHGGVFHILFNMLWLYWIGKIVVEYIGDKRFNAIFFLGGLAGGLAFVVMHNVFAIFGNEGFVGLKLIGASAGVMAVVFAAATLLPDYQIRMFLLGNVKLKYLALGALVLTSILDFSVNTGGKIAHIGGALFGIFFIKQLNAGADMSRQFYAVVNGFMSLFKSQTKMRVEKSMPPRTDKNRTASARKTPSSEIDKTSLQQKTDEILDKISKSGYDSLSKEEKDFLFKVSNEQK